MRTVGSLASGVAHEVKNPLAIIQMGVDFLNAEHGDADEIERQVIDDMDDAITRANKVIMELLDLSRDAELSFSAADINEVINKSLHLVEYETRKHNIAVSTDLDQNIPELQVDSAKLQQVFINLLMNSMQAMGEDGAIQVKSRLFTLRKTRDADLARELHLVAGEKMVVIEVADSGPGIEAEQSAKLFDPFYTTKPVGEGTGLGLAISQKIIQMHCGTIMLGNRKEGGALARITLPIEKRGSCEKEDSTRG
jgi:signal transduction histidine kinase